MSDNIFQHRPQCELCRRQDPVSLFSEDFGRGETWEFVQRYYSGRVDRELVAGTPYEILSCPHCGFIWQSHVLTARWSDALYETWITAEESLHKELLLSKTARADMANQVAMISSLFKGRPPTRLRVLDFGMGWGSWCLMAKAFGFQVYGVELSARRIAHAKAGGIEVIEDLSRCDTGFDFINSEQVFEHVSNPVDALSTLTAKLRESGLVRVSVPDGKRFLRDLRRGGWKPGKDPVHPLEHVNCFTRKALVRLAGRTGLTPISPIRLLAAVGRQFLLGSTSLYSAAARIYSQLLATGIIFEKRPGADS